MMGVNTRNMWSCLQKYNKLNKSHLVGQLLNSIHDARTHVYKIRALNLRTISLRKLCILYKINKILLTKLLHLEEGFKFLTSFQSKQMDV